MEQETQFNKAVIVKLFDLYLTENNNYNRDILNAKVFDIDEARNLYKNIPSVGVVKILNQYEYNNIILDRIEELKSKLLILK